MTTEKRKQQLREAQRRSRAKKTLAGYRWMQIPPELVDTVKELIGKSKEKRGLDANNS